MQLQQNSLNSQTTPAAPNFVASTLQNAAGQNHKPGIVTLVLLTAAAGVMSAMLALLPAVGHDQMWCLYVAQRMLHGVKLYGPEILESNPPLIMWMLLLPAALARTLPIPITVLFKILVTALAGLSGLASLRVMQRLSPEMTRATSWSLAFAFVVIAGALPARDFGQREHLLVLLCLPYVLAAALDATPGRSSLPAAARIGIGIAAGLGLSLKPHHLLLPLALEAALLSLPRSGRSWLRVEPLAILATCLAYLAAIRALSPKYLTDILPVLRDTYWAIGHLTLPQLAFEAIELNLLAAAAIGLYIASGWRNVRPLPLLLLAAGTASSAAYYLQGTGWYYQQIPGLSFFGLAFAVELIQLAQRRRVNVPRFAPVAAAALSILALGLTAYFSGYTLRHPLHFPSGLSGTPDPSFFAGLPAGTPIAILTTVVDDSVPPIATHHLLWAQRENNLWTLPAILRNQSGPTPLRRIPPARLAELDRMQHRWMAEDLARWHPALVLVARCQDPAVHCQILEDRHDDLLAWFNHDPAFQVEFAQYRYLRSSGDYDAYVLK